ncbi:hypothetical protein [Aporhodopirellula aestuarii]|uniref:Uncharacterized protein n=1 Tax=Aporhodopirellula aestuarii TaxID=2950107 RepID=A0ABT0U615_9BACT|nr:hypothetical protein [Aporhodopirellula aestuarii]MCM2372387.1 hypothetical protein [Aporhodopirellula aestuarii]
MVRHEADREDLLVEGVNLPERGRISDSRDDHAWVLGWRSPAAVSVFDGVDPVFQFNTSGQLRRVYLDGQKLAAQNGRLSQMVRTVSANGRMTLHPQALSDEQHLRVHDRLAQTKAELLKTLNSGQIIVETIGMEQTEFLERVRRWCDDSLPVQVADSPNVAG